MRQSTYFSKCRTRKGRDNMAVQARMEEFRTAVGTVADVKRKLANAWRTVTTTFNRQERLRRLSA